MTDDERKDWDAKLDRWSNELAAAKTIGGLAWANEETRLVAATLSADDDLSRLALRVGSWYGSDFEDVPAPRRNYPPKFAQWLRELVEEKTGVDADGGELWDFTVRDFVSAALDRVSWDELADRWLAVAVARGGEPFDQESTS